MSHANPTALRIGMSGPLDGSRFTVLGRVVLSTEVDGETYYWSEFYLGDQAGRAVTLVFEETEQGPTWKLFKLFDPAQPLTAADAAAKREGDTLQLGQHAMQVTLVGRTRVAHIEGAAPDGTEAGDVADYFNAEGDGHMVVVSWTGAEVEFYLGKDLPSGQVEQLFGLPAPKAAPGFMAGWRSGDSDNSAGLKITGVIFAILAIGTYALFSSFQGIRRPEPPAKQMAPVVVLPLGAHGQLAGKEYTIIGYTLAEVAQVGRRFNRHEYLLADDHGGKALLIQGLGGRAAEWHLFQPALAPGGVSPHDSAVVRQGAKVVFGGRTLAVTQLFLETPLKLERPEMEVLWPAKTLYGFVATAGSDWMMLRWSETALWVCQDGRWLAEKDVLAALNRPR